jgi:RHS repeat-associated protein
MIRVAGCRFPRERDTESNLDDFGARYYSNTFGRWMSPDYSDAPVPVPYADLTNPQSLNLYALVRGNPETFADLDGHLDGNGADISSFNASDMFGVSTDTSTTLDDFSADKQDAAGQANKAQNNNQAVGNTTSDALAKTMTNEVGSLSTPKKGDPDVLSDGKDALANALINNANLDSPAKVAKATGTASPQDEQIMKDAATNRANGGADPVEGRTQFGTTHNPHVQSRDAGNHLKGAAGRETVYEKFGPFKDSTSRRPTWIVIYNNPGQ